VFFEKGAIFPDVGNHQVDVIEPLAFDLACRRLGARLCR
jgi:hypothetical protein